MNIIKSNALVFENYKPLEKMFRIPNDVEELVKKIKNSTTLESSSCGHLIPLEESQMFSDHIINFAKNLN